MGRKEVKKNLLLNGGQAFLTWIVLGYSGYIENK